MVLKEEEFILDIDFVKNLIIQYNVTEKEFIARYLTNAHIEHLFNVLDTVKFLRNIYYSTTGTKVTPLRDIIPFTKMFQCDLENFLAKTDNKEVYEP